MALDGASAALDGAAVCTPAIEAGDVSEQPMIAVCTITPSNVTPPCL